MKINANYVLGLDVNTKSTGYAILTYDDWETKEVGIIDTESQNIYEFGNTMKERLYEITKPYVDEYEQQKKSESNEMNIENETIIQEDIGKYIHNKDNGFIIGIESLLGQTMRGRSSAKTMAALSSANIITDYECFRTLHTQPLHSNVTAARGFLKIKFPRTTTSLHKKKIVYDHLEPALPKGFEPERGRMGALKPSAFDISDALLIALYTRAQHEIMQDVEAAVESNYIYEWGENYLSRKKRCLSFVKTKYGEDYEKKKRL